VSAPSNQPPVTAPQPVLASVMTASEIQDAQEAQEALVREMEQSLVEFPSGSSAARSNAGRDRAGSDASLARNPSSVVDPGRARSLSDVPVPRPISQLCPVPNPEEDDLEDDIMPSPTTSIMEAMEQAAVAAELLLSDKRYDPGSVELTPSPRDGSSETDPITGFSVPQPPFPSALANKSGSLAARTDLDPQRGLVTSIVNSMREKSRSEMQQRRHSSDSGKMHSNGEIRSTNGTVRAWIGSPFPTDPSFRQSPQFPHGR
jgi:hypothetical protein